MKTPLAHCLWQFVCPARLDLLTTASVSVPQSMILLACFIVSLSAGLWGRGGRRARFNSFITVLCYSLWCGDGIDLEVVVVT